MGEGRGAVSPKNDAHMCPGGDAQAERVWQRGEGLGWICHRRFRGLGEVGWGQVSGVGCWAEDSGAVGAVRSPPEAGPPLQGAADTIIREGQRMLALKMAQQSDRLQRAVGQKQRQKVGLPIAFKGIGHCASVNDLALRRRGRVRIETPGASLAEPGAGGRCALTVVLEVGHV